MNGMTAYPALGTERDRDSLTGKFSARMRVYSDEAGILIGEITGPPRYDDYFPAEQAAIRFAAEYNRTGVFPNLSEGM